MKMEKQKITNHEIMSQDLGDKINKIRADARKRRVEIVYCMSDAVNAVEKWYEPQLQLLDKMSIPSKSDKRAIVDLFNVETRKKWIDLQHERNVRLEKIEERYMSDLKNNEERREQEEDTAIKECQEALDKMV